MGAMMGAIDLGPVIGLLRALLSSGVTGSEAENEPKLFRMTGQQLRCRIEKAIESCKEMQRAYAKAIADGKTGYDWQYALDNATSNLAEYEQYLEFVTDATFELTPTELISTLNKFSTMRTPDQIIANREAESRKRRQKARDAQMEQMDTANIGGASN